VFEGPGALPSAITLFESSRVHDEAFGSGGVSGKCGTLILGGPDFGRAGARSCFLIHPEKANYVGRGQSARRPFCRLGRVLSTGQAISYPDRHQLPCRSTTRGAPGPDFHSRPALKSNYRFGPPIANSWQSWRADNAAISQEMVLDEGSALVQTDKLGIGDTGNAYRPLGKLPRFSLGRSERKEGRAVTGPSTADGQNCPCPDGE